MIRLRNRVMCAQGRIVHISRGLHGTALGSRTDEGGERHISKGATRSVQVGRARGVTMTFTHAVQCSSVSCEEPMNQLRASHGRRGVEPLVHQANPALPISIGRQAGPNGAAGELG